jgi:hypothetical protein
LPGDKGNLLKPGRAELAEKDQYSYLFERRNSELATRESTWQLINDSYVGGVTFLNGGYLIQYPKESTNSFQKRKERAVYFNQVSPVVDMLSGLLFLNNPTREVPKELSYIEKDVTGGGDKKLDEFMRLVASYSLMFTIGILVDSPDYDTETIKTAGDRRKNNINPYALVYLPFKIRDFSINRDDSKLNWVLLDNSYTDNTEPLEVEKEVISYRLWTREYFQDFEKDSDDAPIKAGEQVPHPVGEVPFKFVSWRDDNGDFIAETIFEDIAMISKLIYNNMSYMDEMLASGTFKMLNYPTKDGKAPKELTSGGVGPLSILPYSIDAKQPPDFIGAKLDEVEPFIKAIELYMSEILKKVGLSTDETKEFVKSGVAKKIDFTKMQALLKAGALMMGKTEEWIFNTSSKWENENKEAKIEYTSAFSDEDLTSEVTMLTELLVHPIKKLRVNVLKLIARKLLANNLKKETLDEILEDIEKNFGAIESNDVDPKELAKKKKEEQEKSVLQKMNKGVSDESKK